MHSLKVDKSFVVDLETREQNRVIVESTAQMAHALGLQVVAEGVETRNAWTVLTDWGCDYAQGFYVASPRTSDELVQWLGASWPAVA